METVLWRELVAHSGKAHAFAPPASEYALNDMEVVLGVGIPPELRALLLESDGIGDEYGRGVLCVEEMLKCNLYLRTDTEEDDLYMPFDFLLFFAEAANGDLFFFPIQGNGKINNRDVFHWNHENDSRIWIASDLQHFVEQWYGGQLQV